MDLNLNDTTINSEENHISTESTSSNANTNANTNMPAITVSLSLDPGNHFRDNSISNPDIPTPRDATMQINTTGSSNAPFVPTHFDEATLDSPINPHHPLKHKARQYGTQQGKGKNGAKQQTFSVRLTPYIDSNSSTNALYFAPIIRKIKAGQIIPIGRYTQKNKEDLNAAQNSDCPIVFKSKVVSRTHAEIGVNEEGKWFIKDLKSSSGTFLRHRRLSAANEESERMVVSEGDLIQLGMDFRGGTEEIYRCVKMRVELNKSWIRKTKAFTKEAHERLKLFNTEVQENELIQCVICLENIKPCQAVFISPCSHSYHYKCIRRVIFKSYPQFLCPTCRALSDLEVDDEDSSEEEDENDVEDDEHGGITDQDSESDDSFRSGLSNLDKIDL